MPKKGFVHLIPLFAIALVLVGALAALSVRKENLQKQAVGKVLSDSIHQDEQAKQVLEANQESAKNLQEQQSEAQKKSQEQQNQFDGGKHLNSGPSFSFENHIKSEDNANKNEVQTQFQSEGSSSAKFEQQIQRGNLKIEVHIEDGRVVAKVHDENGKEVELESSQEAKLAHEADDVLEKEDIEIATGSAELGFVQKGQKVRTNFPLSVDPATGQLFVTTPSGIKVVTVLPSVAIENMIKAGVLTRVETSGGTPTPTPGGGNGPIGSTQGAQASVSGASIQLTEQNNQPVYKISGVKDEKLFGLLPVGVKLTTVVSATNGSLVDIQKGLFASILDLLSN